MLNMSSTMSFSSSRSSEMRSREMAMMDSALTSAGQREQTFDEQHERLCDQQLLTLPLLVGAALCAYFEAVLSIRALALQRITRALRVIVSHLGVVVRYSIRFCLGDGGEIK